MSLYRVKIVALAPARNLPALMGALSKLPGMSPKQIALGLKDPPLLLPPVAQESQATLLKGSLDKLGAVCAIDRLANEDALVDAPPEVVHSHAHSTPSQPIQTASHTPPRPTGAVSLPAAAKASTSSWGSRFLIGVIVLAVMGLIYFLSTLKPAYEGPKVTKRIEPKVSAQDLKRPASAPPAAPKKSSPPPSEAPSAPEPAPSSSSQAVPASVPRTADNPKGLNDKALQNKLVMASIAQAFGGEPKVEIGEYQVIYQAAYPMSDQKFYETAKAIYDTLVVYLPTKGLLVENHAGGKVQRINLGARQRFPERYP
jgi:hypothetical protein